MRTLETIKYEKNWEKLTFSIGLQWVFSVSCKECVINLVMWDKYYVYVIDKFDI